jgi:hypothetical protein
MLTLLPFLMTAAMPLAIVPSQTVALRGRAVHVSDVVRDAAALPPAARAIVIAKLPEAGGRVALTRAALASLVRRGLPGVSLAGADLSGSVAFVVPRLRAARASRLSLAPAAQPPIARGAPLRLTSIVGPVRIDRSVTALQPSRGKRVFVRDADGTVFSVRVASAEWAR